MIKIHQSHNIEWRYLPNTQKMMTNQVHQEEYLYVLKKKEEVTLTNYKQSDNKFFKDGGIKQLLSQRQKNWKFKVLIIKRIN